ncbi:MAG TPA: VOC family protein [Solirubrobacterales bacterium]|nr:VOC family protein [Solirubrobacterales bacterium]
MTQETETIAGRPIVIEFFVSDVERSLAFYKSLGFGIAKRFEDWILLQRGDIKLSLQGDAHAVAGPHYFTPHIQRTPRGTGVEVSIQVADVDAEFIRAKTAGLNIVKGIQDRPWKARDFRLADPDGYFIRITSPLRGE